ncbi:putative kinase domain protein [Rhizoctonia solani 123E]|uniref:Putative kinase domain protein n=1 Tax=Rhizoctonia solani 123E TaxID=1423351 RepID=A0A074RRG7_9AGAM|nr:putative kinase domain protein [Rhizoctonia solani 123E]
MYDACAVQRNLYRKSQILHRNISDESIMFAPDTNEYRECNRKGYAEVKFANQVLSKDRSVGPEPRCWVIGLGNGADLKAERDRGALTERTGTPKFIARSVSSGELLDKGLSSTDIDIPPMEGTLAEYLRFMHTTEYQHGSRSSATQSEVEFSHRLFHDAESTFWVIAWTLARSVGEGSELKEKPHAHFRRFYHIIYRHFPLPGDLDSRLGIGASSGRYWESVMHADLAMLAPMSGKMFRYIRPEWAYQPGLNPEHVHEALMRLLLTEIVKLSDNDTRIVIGGREIPPAPRDLQY